VEGKLVAPWVAEFTTACEEAKAGLHGRALVVDLRNVTAIDRDGENVLLQLIRENVKFQGGVFIKEVLKQLATVRRVIDSFDS
jgi:anti-anti-sigma regulatory factor